MQCANEHHACEMEKIYHDEIKGEVSIATADTYQCPTCGMVKSKLSSKDSSGKFRAKLIDGQISLDDANIIDESIALGKI